jgi:hypothetical protein
MNKQLVALSLVPASIVSFSAFAAVPEAVSTAISTSQTDVSTVAGAVLLIVLAIMTFKWLRRAL